jgi:hypothetical protein
LVERLQTAVDRADETTLAATVLDEPERYREFLSAQSELGAALQSVWSRLQANHGVGSQALVNDLRDHLADVEVSLVGHIAELERSVDAYRERSGSFPGSVLATMTRRAESPGPRGGAGGGAGENLAASAAGPG